MKHSGKHASGKKHLAGVAAAALSLGLFASHAAMAQVVPIGQGSTGQPTLAGQTGPGMVVQSFRAKDFALPQEAKVLVVVEGTGESNCVVYAYEKTGKGWEERVRTPGILGRNGMSNRRTEGDGTTPIGVFRMNTPFGQSEPLEGFPANYVRAKESHVWSDDKNRLVDDAGEAGEQVGTSAYQGYYDYVIDAGYNPKAIAKKGSALFLHCRVPEAVSTGGCVAIAKEQMVTVMRLYGSYGDGACYIAQAPKGTFSLIYGSYGVNDGLSPSGDFGVAK